MERLSGGLKASGVANEAPEGVSALKAHRDARRRQVREAALEDLAKSMEPEKHSELRNASEGLDETDFIHATSLLSTIGAKVGFSRGRFGLVIYVSSDAEGLGKLPESGKNVAEFQAGRAATMYDSLYANAAHPFVDVQYVDVGGEGIDDIEQRIRHRSEDWAGSRLSHK
jgi:hypothetical protein